MLTEKEYKIVSKGIVKKASEIKKLKKDKKGAWKEQ